MSSEDNCTIALCFDPHTDRCRYLPPDPRVEEIAVLLPGDGDQPKDCQDIILYLNDGPLKQISDLHPFYPSLHFVLLHPTGQLSWHPHIPYEELEEGQRGSRHKFMSMAEFHHFHLFLRPPDIQSNHLFLSGKLFQEYVCETWAVSEQSRLNYLRMNQKKLRVEVYQGLQDAVAADADIDLNELGKRFILPSSFSGSTRNMQQHCQDALAINRYFGGGDLFITMTANPAWPEIESALLPGQRASDRPDLEVQVFYAKLQSLIKDIKKGVLGEIAAYLYTIEFQKRGLPHAHIIVFLKPRAKLRTPGDIDSLMSSEFPTNNDELLELIKKFMVHTPCGTQNPQASCMVNGTCSKSFPKPFRAETSVTEDSYARTRHSNTGQTFQIQGREVNNQWVVCHSPYLIWKYRCHINVESIASVKAVKYIYQYVYKGHDRTTMEFGRCRDEIKQYLDARYISSCEALWRLYLFDMQKQVPNVVRLQVHLSDQQGVLFSVEQDPNGQDVIAEHKGRNTTLTAWFEANAALPEDHPSRHLLYQDYPSQNVWNKNNQHKWSPRGGNTFAIGRMYHAHPTAGERFYLRLLLTNVPGATSFQHLCTFGGTLYSTFKDACIAHGLLEDDREWQQCLEEAKHMATGCQLHHLFVTILRDCTPTNPGALWEKFCANICDDLGHQLSTLHIQENPSSAEIEDYGLYLIDQLLSPSEKHLKDFQGMPEVTGDWEANFRNRLIAEQQHYDVGEQAQLAAECIAKLNPDQQTAFDKITSAITTKSGEIFFLHGAGGTGKTFLYNTLCYHLRSQNKIALCVASSGIAALLLKGGRTAHSCFKIPIPCHESSVCNIPKTSHLAELICKTDLVIWDEAPMQHRHNMEAVDRTFRDILNNSEKPFGGLTVVFGGDFQQILPVIIQGSRGQTVGACIQCSILWSSITVLHLHQNMWLNTTIAAEC